MASETMASRIRSVESVPIVAALAVVVALAVAPADAG